MDLDRIRAFDPDQAVLVAALRGVPLPEPDDEFRLASVANWHRVEGLLAVATRDHPIGTPDLRDHFEHARAATADRYEALHTTLEHLVGVWGAAGVHVTALKGASLVEAGIVAAGERPMTDLDVLVSAEQVEEAHRIARDHGFEPRARPVDWAHARTRHHHLPALYGDGQTTIEIHFRLLDVSHPLRGLDDAIRTRVLTLDRLAADRLDDVALWLHLAVHFWGDRRRGTGGVLLQLRDLELVGARVDLDDLVATARKADAQDLVGAVAAVLDEVVSSTTSAGLRGRLGGPPAGDASLVNYLQRRVLGRRRALAQLVHPTASVAYTPWRLLTRARRQLWPPLDDIRKVLGPNAQRREYLASLVPVAHDALANPRSTWRDLRLDRWAHDRTLVP